MSSQSANYAASNYTEDSSIYDYKMPSVSTTSKGWFKLPSKDSSSKPSQKQTPSSEQDKSTSPSKKTKAWKSTKKFLSSIGEPPTAEYDRQQAAQGKIRTSGRDAFGAINYGPYNGGGLYSGSRM